MKPCNPTRSVCSHSISRRLSRKLALLAMLVIGGLSLASWISINLLVMDKNAEQLRQRTALISDIVNLESQAGGENAVLARLKADAPMRASTRLEVWHSDGRVFYADPQSGTHAMSEHTRSEEFAVLGPQLGGELLKARYTMDFSSDARMGRNWAVVLVIGTLAAGACVGFGTLWHVRRQLLPLHDLTAQTRAISPRQLDQRLALADPAEELLPWVEQFNALMQRLEGAYTQIEGFHADVAHELRTPLTTLIGQTEMALSRERSSGSLRDTLASNLEETQRLAAMVNDMLFLSQADRGAEARRGAPVSLVLLARQVVEFHEAPLEDAGLLLCVEGDVTAAVDEPLFKRAVCNLLGNATRFAQRGSTVLILIAPEAAERVRVVVQNTGEAIDAQSLPRLFDRFFRVDASRCCDGLQHHGLGLAIVAAIARMHAGHTLAESQGGVTRVGFTLATD